jgi:ATP-binding protein involved in chromosome partitioning
MLREVTFAAGKASVGHSTDHTALSVAREIRASVQAAAMRVAGVTSVEVVFTAEVARKAGPARQRLPGVRNIIAVAAGKGGVGKSTVATNLAVALAKQGTRVGILDADVFGPSIPQMMGQPQIASLRSKGEHTIVPAFTTASRCCPWASSSSAAPP